MAVVETCCLGHHHKHSTAYIALSSTSIIPAREQRENNKHCRSLAALAATSGSFFFYTRHLGSGPKWSGGARGALIASETRARRNVVVCRHGAGPPAAACAGQEGLHRANARAGQGDPQGPRREGRCGTCPHWQRQDDGLPPARAAQGADRWRRPCRLAGAGAGAYARAV